MKYFLSLSVLVVFFLKLNAQGWVDVGIKGGAGPTFILNNNVWNDKNIGYTLSFGNMLGGKIGYNFNEAHQVTSDITKSVFKQKFVVKSSDSLTYNKEISFSTLDFSFLYRNHSDRGGYVEIGPQYSMVKSAKQKIDLPSGASPGATDALQNYNSSYYSVVFGFGANFMGGNNVSVLLGARMVYGLGDIVGSNGGNGNPVSFPMNDTYYKPNYTAYKTTKPFSTMILLEVTYDLGFFAHSSCGKGRTKFISFD